jgi:pimeloyl-ACP methyl ester carboxylesterase
VKPTIDARFVALDSPSGMRNRVGFHTCQGVYYTRENHRPTTAFIATHYNVDFSEHYLAKRLAAAGYGFLGWNTRFRGMEQYFLLHHALIDIGAGVRWLKETAGVERVVLLGNSGGGSLMAAYQSQAADPNLVATEHIPLHPAVADLPAADLYVSLQAHVGRPEVFTSWLDPSVTDDHDPLSCDRALDMYDPANGPPYSDEFIETYRAAQVGRNHRITAWVLEQIERHNALGSRGRVFSVHRVWADLRCLDAAIEPSDRPIGQCYLGDPRWANYSPYTIGASCTLRTWLSMWSLEHSPCRGAPHLARIAVPSLVVQSTADTGVFPGDAQAIYDALGTDDKQLETIEGDHYLVAPKGVRDTTTELIDSWVRERGG